MAKIIVLDGLTLNPGDLTWDGLRALGEVVLYDRTPDDLVVERARDADVLILNKLPLTAEAISQMPKLRYVGLTATGYNNVDLAAAHARGIVVTNIPTYGTASVAQLATALLLELCHHTGLHHEAVFQGEWSRCPDWSFWKTPLIELSGKTFGVVGFGRIGRHTALVMHALGMRVIAMDAYHGDAPEWPGFRWVELDVLLAESDVVSLHCPLTPETKGLINAQTLAKMKPTAFLLNTSRGGLVVDQDLADALNAGRLAGAGLDVLSVEPPPPDNPLLCAANCIVTPHIAWATREARERLMQSTVENLRAWMAGTLVNVVG